MRHRNLLVHGKFFAFRKNDEIFFRAEYFEGNPQEMILDDKRWIKVTTAIRNTNDLIGKFMSEAFHFNKSRQEQGNT